MKNSKIVVFGGTFNPPTIQHINIVNHILKNLEDVEKLIIVPVSDIYNKPGMVNSFHRINMLKGAFAGNNKVEVSSIEVDADKLLNTVETLDLLQLEYPNREILFSMGLDNVVELPMWCRYEELLTRYKILVMDRNLAENMLTKGMVTIEDVISKTKELRAYTDRFINITSFGKSDISSSLVRYKLSETGLIDSVKCYIDNFVANYIVENGLYFCGKVEDKINISA